MSYITTYTKIRFDPTEPNHQNIRIKDIAHALSLLCRANGHFDHFFSVAQHSINCTHEARARGYSQKVQLLCLLHDASEAYLSDITRPVKERLSEYLLFENRLQSKIYSKYIEAPLTAAEMLEVKNVDDAMLYHEFFSLMNEAVFDDAPEIRSTPDMSFRDFATVEAQFLSEFSQMTNASTCYVPQRPFLSVGIDGCKGGWIAVALTESGFEMGLHTNIAEICEKYYNADSMIIDMPIGLPESSGDMRPDGELRKRLGKKSSSVFSTPCRQAIYAEDYARAVVENKKVFGKSISLQSDAIRPKIRELDAFLHDNPVWRNRLLESHPEYCFAILNGGEPILENKKTRDGAEFRLSLLQKYYPASYAVHEHYIQLAPRSEAKLDDVIDAFVLSVVGAMGLKFGFTTLPEHPTKDNIGLYMQMVGANMP